MTVAKLLIMIGLIMNILGVGFLTRDLILTKAEATELAAFTNRVKKSTRGAGSGGPERARPITQCPDRSRADDPRICGAASWNFAVVMRQAGKCQLLNPKSGSWVPS